VAERDYAAAAEAVPHLPGGFRRAVVVAAAVYRGIHDAVRRNGYDTLRRRAATGRSRKLLLAAGALARAAVVRPHAHASSSVGLSDCICRRTMP
jgi:phytoene synthase